MFEKVNPSHPDKIADRIAGAIVDVAYRIDNNVKIAVEVLIGHGECNIIIESNVNIPNDKIENIVYRICETNDDMIIDIHKVPQDAHLAANQCQQIKCGDNGIFKGMPITTEENYLTSLVQLIYKKYPHDGKYIIDNNSSKIIGCQSYISNNELYNYLLTNNYDIIVNPLGEWTGGINVDSGATNRKLGSDMGESVTGGGLHGKDLSKADISINIYCFLKAQETGKPYTLTCAIGDEIVDGKPYSEIVEIARDYINSIGGFEKFAEWGLIR